MNITAHPRPPTAFPLARRSGLAPPPTIRPRADRRPHTPLVVPPGTVHTTDRPGRRRSAHTGRSLMSAMILPATTLTDAHRAFDAALGRIDAALRYRFRRWPRAEREDAIAEARAYTWAAWHGLLRRGKDPAAVGAVAIAANSCRAVKNGRSVG